MAHTEFSYRTMTTISLTIIVALIALGTLTNIGLHKLRLQSATMAEDEAIYALAYRALQNSPRERLMVNANLDAKTFSEFCTRVVPSIGQKDKQFELAEWLACDFDGSLPFNLQVLRVTTVGYNPGLELLIGIENSSRIGFLRVLEHQETSSFGSELVTSDSRWLAALTGQRRSSFVEPMTDTQLDAVSGATITANAIRRAVGNTFLILDNAELPPQ